MSSVLDVLTRYSSELLGPGNATPIPSAPPPPLSYGFSQPKPSKGSKVSSSLPPIQEAPVAGRYGIPTTLPPIQGIIEAPDQGMVPLSGSSTGGGSNDAYFSSVLAKAGLPATPQNLHFLNAWAKRESVPQNIDRYNLLGTTLPYGGSTGTNSANVQNYPSLEAGTSALAQMFGQSNMAGIAKALATGNIYAQRNNPALQAAFKLWSGGGYSFPVSGGYTPPAPTPISQATAPVAPFAGQLHFSGVSTQGLNQSFVSKLSAAARAVGASGIRLISGYRSPEHNAAVGGASRSNHLAGRAIDGYAIINGKEVPIGVAIAQVADQFGLRSGANDPTFFHGAPDPNHVDDGYNQG